MNVKSGGTVHIVTTRLLWVYTLDNSRIGRLFSEREQKPVTGTHSRAGSLAHVIRLWPGKSWVRLRVGGKRFVSPKVQTGPRVHLILYLVGIGSSPPPGKVPRLKITGVTRPLRLH